VPFELILIVIVLGDQHKVLTRAHVLLGVVVVSVALVVGGALASLVFGWLLALADAAVHLLVN